MLIATPKFLTGSPLSIDFTLIKNTFADYFYRFVGHVLSGLPKLNGILNEILPKVGCQCQSNPSSAQTPSLPITTGLGLTGLGESTCSRCGALIDIHNNEINGVKLVLG